MLENRLGVAWTGTSHQYSGTSKSWFEVQGFEVSSTGVLPIVRVGVTNVLDEQTVRCSHNVHGSSDGTKAAIKYIHTHEFVLRHV